MLIIQDKYKKVADFCYKLFQIAELPLHFSKFSNKLYSTYQKLFLLVYKQSRKFTYEDLMNDVESNPTLKSYLGFKKLPVYTTLVHFCSKLPQVILDKLVIAFKQLIPEPKNVAIDSTGISLDNASPHYCKRLGIPYKKRPFMKASFIVDVDNFLILLVKGIKGHKHDIMEGKKLIKKLKDIYKPDILFADRAYDDEDLFKFLFEEIGTYPCILQKNIDLPRHNKKGEMRKMTHSVFDYGLYLNRNKIETCNSIFKKRFNSNIKARTNKTQKIELFLRVIAYNIDRLLKLPNKVILIFIRITRVSY